MKKEQDQWYGIYVCVGQGSKSESAITQQVKICTDAIISRHGEDAKDKIKIYVDMGFSTINPDRPQYNALMEDIKAGKIKTITVKGMDRISRSVSLSLLFKELADKFEVKIFAPYIDIEEDFMQNPEFFRAVANHERLYGNVTREYEAECESIHDKFYNQFLEEHEEEIEKLLVEAKEKYDAKCKKIEHGEKIRLGKESAKQKKTESNTITPEEDYNELKKIVENFKGNIYELHEYLKNNHNTSGVNPIVTLDDFLTFDIDYKSLCIGIDEKDGKFSLANNCKVYDKDSNIINNNFQPGYVYVTKKGNIICEVNHIQLEETELEKE